MRIYEAVKDIDENDIARKGGVLSQYDLGVLEKVNPCNQKYHMNEEEFFITYDMKLNILNFNKYLNLRVPATMVGLPFSVCAQAFKGDIQSFVKGLKGMTVVLNCDEPIERNCGQTLSTYIFENRFRDFGEYLDALRSNYRYRIQKALKKRDRLTIEKIESKDFDEELYQLYEEVFNNSEDQLEKLSLGFFQTYPGEIYVFKTVEGESLGFVQTKAFGDELLFLFGGFSREYNSKYDLYYNMILWIIELGIKGQYRTINMGQTADATKLKVGCKEQKKYMYCFHSNAVLNGVLGKLVPYFSYKSYAIEHRVFKRN